MQFIILFIFLTTSLFSNTDVILELKWKHQFQFAGFYMAKEKGFYKTNGLNVKINEYEVTSPLEKTLKNNLTFGISDSSLIYDKMLGTPVTAIIAIYQNSPLSFITLKESGFKTPLDLENKIIETSGYSEVNSSTSAMLKSFNINYSRKFPTFDVGDLIAKRTDAISGYVSNQAYKLSEIGIETVIFHPKDYGYDFYGDILFTSNETLEKYPSEVNAFAEASVLGWKYAFENIEETVDLILEKYNTQNKTKKQLLYEASVLKKFAGDFNRFGELNIEKIKNIASMYDNSLTNTYNMDYLNDFVYKKNILYLNQFHYGNLNLSESELEYLQKNKVFNICTNSESFPLSGSKNNQLIGIMGEVFKNISKILEVQFKAVSSDNYDLLSNKIKNNECQFLDMIDEDQIVFKNITTTKSLKSSKMLLVGSKHSKLFHNISDLKEAKIYTNFKRYKDHINRLYPNLNVIYEPDLNKITMAVLESNLN